MIEEKKALWPLVRRMLRIAIAIAACAVLSTFLLLNIAPSGAEVRYSIALDQGKEAALKGAYALGQYDYERSFEIPASRMEGDQTAFYINTPYEQYDEAEVNLQYKGDPDELLVKVSNGSDVQSLTEPANNRVLNNLDWLRTEENSLVFLQREPEFSTIGDLLSSTEGSLQPDIATYNYFLALNQIADTTALAGCSLEDINLRGPHEALVYVMGGSLDLTLSKIDLNMYVDRDPMAVRVFDGKRCIFTDVVEDDGDGTASLQPSSPTPWGCSLAGLANGYYRVLWDCNMDVIVTDITSSSGYFSLLDHVFLAQGEYYGLETSGPVSLYTSSTTISAEIWHVEACQELLADGKPFLYMDSVGEPFVQSLPEGIKQITTGNPDVVLDAPGSSFAISEESLIVAAPQLQDVPLEDINYIIADYSFPQKTEDGYFQELRFDLRDLKFDNHVVQVILTAPGLSSRGETVELTSLELRLKKE